jgi:hypothetical protein
MNILWFIIEMVIYGFIIGLIIGIGAFCYALISIRFDRGVLKQEHKMVTPPSCQHMWRGTGNK